MNVTAAAPAGLTVEPEPIRQWLDEFRAVIFELHVRASEVRRLAGRAATIPLGSFSMSEQLRAKLARRLGPDEGGLAWVVHEIIGQLTAIHEELRRSLETHLHADLAAEETIRTGTPAGR